MKKQISILRSLTASLLALTMLCALPLFTACGEDSTEPVETPKKELPADAGAITQTPLEDGTIELSVAVIAGAETYRWYKDGESVQNSADRTYLVRKSGNYKVAGVNRNGEGKASEEVKVTLLSELLPATPTKIDARLLPDGSAEISVDEIERATSYRFYRDSELVQEGESRVYIDPKPTVSYGVSGVNEYGEGQACFVTVEWAEPYVAIEATKLAFNDIQIKVDVMGVAGYYAGNTMTEAFVAEDVLASLEMLTPSTQMHYEGALVDFPEPSGEVIMPGISYTIWVVFPKEDSNYTVEDILTFEFTAAELTSGGSINVEAGKPYITQNEVEVELSAEGAYAIHMAWLTEEQQAALTDTAAKAEMLLNATQFEGDSAFANSSTTLVLEPETNVYLMALAIDQEGRYGEIFEQMYTTLPEPKTFTLILDEELCSYTETSASIQWTIEDGEAVETVYYMAPADDNFWLSTLGESFDRAIEYIQIYPTHKNFNKVTNQTSVELTGLTEGRRYVFVAVAFDADGNPSVGDGIFFTPQSNVVFVKRYLEDGTENPEWTASCPTIHVADYCFVKAQFTRLFWTVDLAEGTTGYTTAISAAYVAESFSTEKAWAQDIVANPDNSYSVYYWEPDDPRYPDPNHELGGGSSVSARSTEVFEDKIYYNPRAHGDTKIYVTWKDAQGRLYECVSVDMPIIEAE